MPSVVPAVVQFDELRRTRWRLKMRSGYLWIQDRLYYLYAKKRAIYYRDTRELRAELAGLPVDGTVQVKVEGIPWTNWHLEGRTIVVSLMGLEGRAGYCANLTWDLSLLDFFKSGAEAAPDNFINVAYDYKAWNATTKGFDVNSIVENFRIGSMDVLHRMPADYVRGAPVVITDDTVKPWDGRGTQLQFKIVEPSREIQVNGEPNLVLNPHFSEYPTGQPSVPGRWYLTEPTGAARVEGSGYVDRAMLAIDGTGKVAQDVEVVGGSPVVVEAWYQGDGSGEAFLELAFKTPASGRQIVDTSGNPIGWDPDFGVYSVRVSGQVSRDWSRLSVVLGQGTEFDPADALYPDVCDRIEIRLWKNSANRVRFGAVRSAVGVRPGQYIYVPDSGTVEYETDPSGFYRHHPREMFPYEDAWDADANPVNDESHGGFLAVTEDGAPVDEDLGLGELVYDDPAAYGTGYPQGVVAHPSGVRHLFGRRNLPYAKVDGYQKLRQTQIFDLENQPPSLREVTVPTRAARPGSVVLASPGNMYRDQSGLPRLVVSPLTGAAEFVAALFSDGFGNGIVGDWVEIFTSGAAQASPSGMYTNHAGRVSTRVSSTDHVPGSGVAELYFRHYASQFVGSLIIDVGS